MQNSNFLIPALNGVLIFWVSFQLSELGFLFSHKSLDFDIVGGVGVKDL